MKRSVKFLIVIAIVLALTLSITACAKNNDSDYQGTYYAYNDNVKDPDDWIRLDKDSWTDDDGETGKLVYENGYLYAHYEIFGEDDVLFYGSVSDGVFTFTFGEGNDIIGKAYYRYYSDNSSADPKSSAPYFPDNEEDPEGNPPAEQQKTKYSVTFDSMGGSNVNSMQVEEGSKLTAPTEPTKGGFTFGGWYKDNNFQTEWNFDSDTVTGNITLYADWEAIRHDVTFNANGGKFADENETIVVTVNENDKLDAAQVQRPTKSGFTFRGWYKDNNFQTEWNFDSDTVTGNITLYANWEAIRHNVTFNANGGKFADENETIVVTVNENDKLDAVQIQEPTKSGFKFNGWYKNADGQTGKWNFEDEIVTDDITLYAGWERIIIEHTVTFNLNYPGAGEIRKSTENGLVNYTPTRDGYVFNGWWLSDGATDAGYVLSRKFDVTQEVTEDDLVLYAEWVPDVTQSIQLPAPSVQFDIATGNFNWEPIRGASGYQVVIKQGDKELYNESTANTKWDFPSYYKSGYYSVNIRANGNGMNNVNSNFTSKEYPHLILTKITNISFDVTTSMLTWSKVMHADHYSLYIDDMTESVAYLREEKYDMTLYSAGSHAIKIVAERFGSESTTAYTTIIKRRLTIPENLLISLDDTTRNYIIAWDEVKGANAYIVTLNGDRNFSVEENTFTLLSDESIWESNDILSLTVRARDMNGDYLVSDECEIISLERLYRVTVENEMEEAGSIETINGDDMFVPRKEPITVRFDYGYGERIEEQNFSTTNVLDYPEIPTRSKYVFRGWYTEPSCENLFDFSKPVIKSITLYAGWHSCDKTNYNNIYIIDVANDCNNTDNARKISTYYTTSYKPDYYYFVALTAGEYSLYFGKNSGGANNYQAYFRLRNETVNGDVITEYTIESNAYRHVEFDAKAGDVFSVAFFGINTNSQSNISFFVTGGKLPQAGGEVVGGNFIPGEETDDLTVFSKIGKSITLTINQTDDRYTFNGWYNGDQLLSKEMTYTLQLSDSDLDIKAKWTYYTVTTETNLEGAGTFTEKTDEIIKVGEEVTLTAKTNPGYTWVGWFKNGEKVSTGTSLSYTFEMPEEELTLIAKWIKVTLATNDSEGGSITQLTDTYVSGQTITVTAKCNKGYGFLGWFENEKLLEESESYELTFGDTDKTIVAKFAQNIGNVFLIKTINEAGTVSYSGTGNIGEEITVTAVTNPGYTWVGWFDDDTKVSNNCELTYTFNMPGESKTLTAKWIECPVTLTQNLDGAGSISGVEGATAVGEDVVVTAKTNPGYIWDGWYENGVKVSTGDSLTYTFVMPEQPKTLEARWKVCDSHTYGANHICTKCGQLDNTVGKILGNGYIEFGSYPQSKVEDTDLQSTLTGKAGTLPTSDNAQSWTSYGYYINGSVSNYMWYIDVDHNGEKYRGVYFTSYRPYDTMTSSSTGNSYQGDNGYTTGKVYWFKWEPIKWRILQNNNGETLILADMILDSQQFDISSNNYAQSDIRAWLNDDFYNAAFTTAQKELIKQTLVDNSASTTANSSNSYACENTNDNIFLLSYKDILNTSYGFSSSSSTYDTARRKKTTAYAQCQGAYTNTDSSYRGNGWWWLRSPSSGYSYYAIRVYCDGYVYYTHYNVDYPDGGVCPALKIALDTM